MHALIDKSIEPIRVLLVILLAVTVAQTGWFFITGPTPEVLTPQSADRTIVARPSLSILDVADLNLFGNATSMSIERVESNFNASQTRLRLELQAVFQADHPENSAAIVAESKRPGLLYKIGSKMPGNAILQEVFADRIVLKRGGVFETLRFPKSKELLTGAQHKRSTLFSAKTGSTPAGQKLSSANTNGSNPAISPLPPEAFANTTSTNSELSRAISQFQTNLKNDPKTTLKQIGLSPVNSGNADGYRLGGLSNSPYLKQTGLQANDVILSVNNQPVGDIQQDQIRIANVLAQGSARLEVLRGDRRFFVTASLK